MNAITILNKYHQDVLLLMILKNEKKRNCQFTKNRIAIILFDDNLIEISIIQIRLIGSYR
jgi:hypothetical protein